MIFVVGGVESGEIERMTDLLRHRGPDDFGYVFFDRAGQLLYDGKHRQKGDGAAAMAMGHRRLTIIDLGQTGHQPMSYADGRYWISYNGEIYNYIELRNELKQLGYRFRGSSDTEVVLAAYCQWGRDCVGRFNGMWAFAIWDTKRGTLFLQSGSNGD